MASSDGKSLWTTPDRARHFLIPDDAELAEGELDAVIQARADNWAMNRMAAVDRNVLRLAAFELTARPDTPLGVVIDEAIEIVRKYSAEEATRFVNGIIDALKAVREAPKPKKAAKPKKNEPEPENKKP